VAWWVAHLYPERVSKLGILNVPHPKAYNDAIKEGTFAQLLKSWYIIYFQTPYLPEHKLLKNNCTWLLRVMSLSGIPGKKSPVPADSVPLYLQAWTEPGAMTAMLNYYRCFGIAANLTMINEYESNPMIKPPTLILWGKQDIALEAELAPRSANYCDNGRMKIFEDGSHWLQHDKPQEVTEELLSFFSS